MGNRVLVVGGSVILLGALASMGCSDEVEQAKQTAAAANALVEMAGQAQKTAEAVEAAQNAAEAEARAATPEDATPEQAKQRVDMAKAMAAMQAVNKTGGGPVVNWRQLAPFLGDELSGYKSKGELDGATKSAGAMEITEVKRRYGSGEKKMRVQISDTSMAGMLRAPFAMAAMIREDSTRGYKKGKKVGGHSTIVEWEAKSKRSKATAMVAERFLVMVQIDGTETDAEAEQVLAALPLDDIAKVKAQPVE